LPDPTGQGRLPPREPGPVETGHVMVLDDEGGRLGDAPPDEFAWQVPVVVPGRRHDVVAIMPDQRVDEPSDDRRGGLPRLPVERLRPPGLGSLAANLAGLLLLRQTADPDRAAALERERHLPVDQPVARLPARAGLDREEPQAVAPAGEGTRRLVCTRIGIRPGEPFDEALPARHEPCVAVDEFADAEHPVGAERL